MSAPQGPRGGPGPAAAAAAAASAAGAMPEMPDLSHLTEDERKIILGVMDRQKKEEAKEQSMLNCTMMGWVSSDGRHFHVKSTPNRLTFPHERHRDYTI
ncbi:hypothetical protein PAMA_014773 [Pampus argenteus]